jgi:cell division septation protein DedD
MLVVFAVSRQHHSKNQKRVGAKKKGSPIVVQEISQNANEEKMPQTGNPNVVFYTSVGGATSEPTNEPPPSEAQNRFTIEIAQFSNQQQAEALLLQLRNKGITGFYTPFRKNGEVVYRVRLGVYNNPDDAQKSLQKIAKSFGQKGQVTKLQ